MGSTGELFAPSFVRKPQLRQEDDGNRLIFECKLAGNPKPELFWFREDKRIEEDERTSIRITEDAKNTFSVILELNDVVETDAGLYKVKAKNKYGEVSASINLNFSPVDAPPQPQVDGTAPTFSKKPTIRQEEEGRVLVFHCGIVADPLPTITWYHNGVKVQDTTKYQVVTKQENQYTFDSSLIMRDVTVEDAGKYKITARNDLGESNATISLNFDSDEATIPQGGVKPTFTERPVIRQSDEGNKIIFQCKLAGEPEPKLVWYHGEKMLKESTRIKMTMKEEKKTYFLCCLEISNVEAADAGQYRAVASNASGESQATINLTFEESGGIVGKPKIPDGIAPRFPRKPTIRQEGDNLVLECSLEANPMPEITWYRQDKRVEETQRMRYECKKHSKNKYVLTLTIKEPSLKDAGMYRCNAFNAFGDSNANIDLNFETGDEGDGGKKPAEPEKAAADKPAEKAAADSGFPPTFTEKPRIVPNETGTLVTMKFKVKSCPKAEMQWFKGSEKISEGAKFKVKYVKCGDNEWEVMLDISKPCADDGGDYKCMMKNDHGQLQAKLNLNIEAEPESPAPQPAGGAAPTFVEKPKIVTEKDGKLIMLVVKYRATAMCKCEWSYKETKVVETKTTRIVHEKVSDYFESRMELTDPAPENAGLYKCFVRNEFGEINANLSLNIEVAPVIKDKPTVTKVEKKKSVVLQCAVQGNEDIEVQWFKEGQAIDVKKDKRYSVTRKKSEVKTGETIVELEIMDTEVEDKGIYKLVAKSKTGECQSQAVQLLEEQVKEQIGAETTQSEDSTVKKKKKKVVKKKKKKEEKKELKAPEIASFLKNFIKKEGEDIEFKCRLEDEMEEGECKMQWYFNDSPIEANDKYLITFDGLYASLQMVNLQMADAGTYKVVFSNEAGEDESAGKVNVKEDGEDDKTVPKEVPVEDEFLAAERERKKAEEEAAAKAAAAAKAYKPIKKVEKKEPQASPEQSIGSDESMYKLPKKKPSLRTSSLPKEEPKEDESPFGKIKLKKSETVKRTWEDEKMETVDLKHHEFEKPAQEEQPEGKTSMKLSDPIEESDDSEKEKAKKKKKKKAKTSKDESDEEPESEPAKEPTPEPEKQEEEGPVVKLKKSVSFKETPEVETYDKETEKKMVKKTIVKRVVKVRRKSGSETDTEIDDNSTKDKEIVTADDNNDEVFEKASSVISEKSANVEETSGEEDKGKEESTESTTTVTKDGKQLRSWVLKKQKYQVGKIHLLTWTLFRTVVLKAKEV